MVLQHMKTPLETCAIVLEKPNTGSKTKLFHTLDRYSWIWIQFNKRMMVQKWKYSMTFIFHCIFFFLNPQNHSSYAKLINNILLFCAAVLLYCRMWLILYTSQKWRYSELNTMTSMHIQTQSWSSAHLDTQDTRGIQLVIHWNVYSSYEGKFMWLWVFCIKCKNWMHNGDIFACLFVFLHISAMKTTKWISTKS
jgi:hypothetical protein